MRKVLHVFKILFLLAWLAFVILCCHSCLMAINSGAADTEGPAVGGSPVSQPAAPAAPAADNYDDWD